LSEATQGKAGNPHRPCRETPFGVWDRRSPPVVLFVGEKTPGPLRVGIPARLIGDQPKRSRYVFLHSSYPNSVACRRHAFSNSSLWLHGSGCGQEVLWMHADGTAARAIKISNQKKRDGNDERQDEEQQFAFTPLAVTDQ
jgi:hypothetical protein